MRTAGEVCNRTVVVATEDETLVEAARLMREHHVGDVVVVEERNGSRVPIGILTDRDITVGVVATAPERLTELKIGDVVFGALITLPVTADLLDVIRTMREHGIRRIPVVRADGGLVGIIALDDVLELMAEEMNELSRVAEREHQREKSLRSLPHRAHEDHSPRLWGPAFS